MATITNIASRMKDENNYTTPSDTITEYLIDNAIDHINLVAGTSIADLSGSTPTKSLTATENELAVIKTLVSLLLRAWNDKGPQGGTGGVSVTEVTSDPHYRVQMKLFNQSLNYLRGRSFVRT